MCRIRHVWGELFFFCIANQRRHGENSRMVKAFSSPVLRVDLRRPAPFFLSHLDVGPAGFCGGGKCPTIREHTNYQEPLDSLSNWPSMSSSLSCLFFGFFLSFVCSSIISRIFCPVFRILLLLSFTP